tara:strand:+ start:1005 stop:1472 length:468 start_codon:yes stop_codon:yes gene_type:complete
MFSNNNEKRLTTYASLLQNIREDKDVSSLRLVGPHVSVYKEHTDAINKIHSKYKNSEGMHSEKEQKHLNALSTHHSELSKFHTGLANVYGFIGDTKKSSEHNMIAATHEGLSGKVNPNRSLASQKKGFFYKADHGEAAEKISDLTKRGHDMLKGS